MSVDLGSAHGQIILDAAGAASGVNAAVAALGQLDARARQSGQSLATIGTAAQRAGSAAGSGFTAANASVGAYSANLGKLGAATGDVSSKAAQSFAQISRLAQANAQAAGSANTAATALSRVGSASNGIASNLTSIGAAANTASSGLKTADSSARQFATSAEQVKSALGTIGNSFGLAGGGIVAGLGAAVKQASDLQTIVARISTIAPDIDTTKVTASLTGMSTRVAQTSTQLAESLNQIFSSIDVNQTQALALTEQFGKGAVAAGTDAETFGTAVLGVLNAYSLSTDQASHISDVFFNTLDKGVINGDELAKGLGQVTQNAKNAGVNFDTLGALIAGVTREGGEAATNVNNLANALAKITTADTQKGLNDLGVVTKDASGNYRDIVAVLGDLKAKLDAMAPAARSATLQNLFPDQQARNGITVLLNQLGTVNDVLQTNATQAGRAEQAYQKMGQTAAAQGQLLKNTLNAALVDVGNIVLPDLVGVATQVRTAIAAFRDLDPATQGIAIHTAEAAAGLLLVSAGAIKAAQGIISAVTTLRTLTTALNLALVGANGLAAALGPLAIAFLSAEVASRALTGEGFVQNIASIARYGDVLGGAREQVAAFGKANQDNLPAINTEIAALQQHLADLQAVNAKNAGFSIGALLDLPQQPQRNKEINETILKLRELLKIQGEYESSHPQYGPPVPIQNNAFATGAQAIQAYTANTIAAKQAIADAGITANDTAEGLQNLTTATLAAIAAERQQATNAVNVRQREQTADDLKAQAAGMQAVTGVAGPLSAALDQINARRAQGLPLTAQEANLLQQIPGYLGEATVAQQNLTLAAAATQIVFANQGGGIFALGGAFSGVTGQASGLAGEIDRLTGSLLNLDSATNALNSQNSALAAQFNALDERAQAIEEKRKSGTANADDLALLAQIRAAEKEIGDQRGQNADQIVRNILAHHQEEGAIKEKTAALVAASEAASKAAGATALGGAALAGFGVPKAAPTPPPPPPPAPVVVPIEVKGPAAGANAVAQAIGLPSLTTPPPPVQVPIEVKSPAAGANAVAEALGLSGTGGGITVPVTLDVKGPAAGANAVASVIGAAQSQTVTVSANDQATPVLNDVKAKLTEINQAQVNPPLTVQDNASGPIGLVQGAMATLAATNATPTIGIVDSATAGIQAAQAALGIFAGSSANPPVSITDNASGPLASITGAVNALAGRSINITASVDTSGALAAIQNLRDHMPSSPSKLGGFRKLPDWSSVYGSLAPASAEAVGTIASTTTQMARSLDTGIDIAQQAAAKGGAELVSTIANAAKAAAEALGAIASFRLPSVGRFDAFRSGVSALTHAIVDAAAEFGADGLEAAGKLADTAGKIVGLVKPAVDGFAALSGIVEPTGDQIGILTFGLVSIAQSLVQAARDFDAEGLTGATGLADASVKILALVKPAVEAFGILPGIVQPTGDQLGVLTQGVIDITLSIVQAARYFEDEGLGGASSLADAAGKILALIEPAVTGFKLLRDVVQPTGDQLGVFTQGVVDITLSLVNASRLFTAQGLTGASGVADTAGKILALIKPAIDGFKALPGIMQPTGDQLGVFTAGIVDITLSVVNGARNFTGPGLTAASGLADAALKILGLVKPAIDGFRALSSVTAPSQAGVAVFAAGVVTITRAIVVAAAQFAAEGLAGASSFADTASKSLGLIETGTKALATLADPDAVLGLDGGRLDQFAASLRQFVVTVGNLARTVNADLVREAGEFSDGAGKAVGLLSGVDAFAKLADFQPISPAQIDAFVAAVVLSVQRVGEASKRIDAETAKAAGTFAESAGKVTSLIGSAISAFTIKTNVDKDGNAKQADRLLTTAEIDQVVFLAQYAVGRLVGVAQGFDKGALAGLAAFGDAASKGFGALRGVLDTIQTSTKDNTPKEGTLTPLQAIDALIGLFNQGLGRLGTLVGIAQQYLTAAQQVRSIMLQAGAAFGEGLGALTPPTGVSPQALALAAGGTFTVNNIITHRFEGVVTLNMPADDGAFVARSIRVDGQSRRDIADQIANELILAGPGGAQ